MMKKILLLATVAASQAVSASPAQFKNINKSYELTCQTNGTGDTAVRSLTLKGDRSAKGEVLIVNTDLLGQYDLALALKDQKVLDYKSDDSFPKTYNYTETKYPNNEIIWVNTIKAGVFGREGLQAKFKIKFTDSSLSKGTMNLTTYWPKKNNETLCSVTEK